MSEFRKNRELPYQSYQRIKKNVLSSKKNGGISGVTEKDLFIDPSFPPDKTSLTYVYSGDDRYEKMVFKRPPAITKNAVFVGVGGCWDATFPWKQFRKRRWFEAAVVVLSLSVKYLEKVINGYRNCEQNYSSSDYIGAFIFNIWRFGEFVEAIVDDNLPVLDNKLLYCPAHGNPPEYWGALLHKAYAKIMKTYEAIECGNMVQEKQRTHAPEENTNNRQITLVSKFPTTDGRMIEMVRDVVSWRSLNSDFKNKYRPFTNKEEDEYWMTLEDFRCNFGGLVICSQTDPYKPDGFNVERMYIRKKTTDFDYTGPNKDVHPMPSSRRIRYFRGRRHSSTPNCYGPGMFRSRGIEKEEKKREIKVRECEKTVKFDSTYQNPIDST
ncbi:hypothetical protein KUTeg_000230 [Tegillarca granosa]|uniref:Calpain catalytic domain-containing protein n=1 Tax=Tegillarca granosa TaxID=220873 RepID=A0ABQ9FWY7_TEGGR|nr:hypothetical protein KUTeg_000230 [Tegillarca granosa]